jgi:hypothetical protein
MSKELIGNGRTAEVMGYDETSVLKLFRPFMNDAAVEKEYAVASYAHQNGLPTPKPISRIKKDDRRGIVYERINGTSLLRLLSENPMQMKAIAR